MTLAAPQQSVSLMPIVRRPHNVMTHGHGSWLYDENGRAYLDFVQGWAVACLGHAPVELHQALTHQASQLLTVSPAYYTLPQLELSDALTRITRMQHVFLCNSGAEANDAAIKLARKWGQRHKAGAFGVITTHNSFHGRTLATVAASGKPGWDTAFPPNLAGFTKVPFGDVNALADAINDQTCAVMLEPIQGEAGVVLPPDGYLREVRQLTRAKGVLLILDEVQTGCARTGHLLRAQAEDVQPDVLTLGKGLGGGVPIAALLASKEASCFEVGDHGGTYCGNPLTAACALAVLRVISEPEFLAHVRNMGRVLQAELQALQRQDLPNPVLEVRGAGLLWAIRLQFPQAESLRDACFAQGLLLNAPRPDLLRFMPQLRVTHDEVVEAVRRLKHVLQHQG